ncbi:hypothetical protein, partial [Mesorhizobium sp. M7A.F.Ca.CA.001.06.1.1]|uniref:hypothetical protein n=1 Tax=Mesorhizobium sp. M7A.F.Ca.CA.001.06.1.1 TaxID=2496682 RepID=UPI0019CFA3D8
MPSTIAMKQASSDLVDELISMKFVQEMKSTQQRVGKPPTPLEDEPPSPSRDQLFNGVRGSLR